MSLRAKKFANKGATFGAVAGYAIGKIYLHSDWSDSFDPNNILLVYAVSIGLCAAVGYGIALILAPDDNPPS